MPDVGWVADLPIGQAAQPGSVLSKARPVQFEVLDMLPQDAAPPCCQMAGWCWLATVCGAAVQVWPLLPDSAHAQAAL